MKMMAKKVSVLILALLMTCVCMPVFPVTSVYAASENTINAVWNGYVLEWDKINGVSHYEMWVNHKFAGDMNANTPITRHQVDFSETIDQMIENGDLSRSDDNYYDITVQALDGSENQIARFADTLEYDAPQPDEGIENIALDGTVLTWDNTEDRYYRFVLMINDMSVGDYEYSGQEHYELDLAKIIDTWVTNGWIAKSDSNMYEIGLQATNEDYTKDTTWTNSLYYEPQELPPLSELSNLNIDGNVLSWDPFISQDGTQAFYYEYYLTSEYYSESESGLDGGLSTDETSVDLIPLVGPINDNMLDLDRFIVTVRAYNDQYELLAESSMPMPPYLDYGNLGIEFEVNGGILTWDAVEGATGYVCYIDDCPVYLPESERSADLNALIDDFIQSGQIKAYQTSFGVSLYAYDGLHVIADRYVEDYSYTSSAVQTIDIHELPSGNLTWQSPGSDTSMYVVTGTYYGDGGPEQTESLIMNNVDNDVDVEFDPAELYCRMNPWAPDVTITVTAYDLQGDSMNRTAVGTYNGLYSGDAGVLEASVQDGQLSWTEYPEADYYIYTVTGNTSYSDDGRKMYGWQSVYCAETGKCLVDLDADITNHLLFWDSNYQSGQDADRTFQITVTAYDSNHKVCAFWKDDYDYSFEYGAVTNVIAYDNGYLEWDPYDGNGPLDYYKCVITDASGHTTTLSTEAVDGESSEVTWVVNVNETIDWEVYYGWFDKPTTSPYSVTVYACTEDGRYLAEGTTEYDYSPNEPDLEELWSFGDYYIDKDGGEYGILYFEECKSTILNSCIAFHRVYINDIYIDTLDNYKDGWYTLDISDAINRYLENGGEVCDEPSGYSLTIRAIYYREYPGTEMQVCELPVSFENAMALNISDGILTWDEVPGAAYYTLEVDGDEYQELTDEGWEQYRFENGLEGCSLDDILADYSYLEKTDHFIRIRAFGEDDNEIASGGKAYQTQLEYATIGGCWLEDDCFYWEPYTRYHCPCFYRLGIQDEEGNWIPLGVVPDNFKPLMSIEARIDWAVWKTRELEYQEHYTITVEGMNHTANPLTEPAQFDYAYTPCDEEDVYNDWLIGDVWLDSTTGDYGTLMFEECESELFNETASYYRLIIDGNDCGVFGWEYAEDGVMTLNLDDIISESFAYDYFHGDLYGYDIIIEAYQEGPEDGEDILLDTWNNDISNDEVFGVTDRAYVGKQVEQEDLEIAHHFFTDFLEKDADYEAIYRNNDSVGEAGILLVGKGLYKGAIEVYFNIVKPGWQKIDGGWYYFNNDGSMAVSTWKKDSKGWCYLGDDGRMVTNDWVKDSKGWCWIASDGYMPVATKWIKYEGGWYYIEKGYRVQNVWRKDSKGWCYLGSDGRMVTNDWVKDSKGYCWIASDGYMPVATKWISYEGGWYYIEKGYRVQNVWRKDSKGWCYLGFDGRMVTNDWVKDSKGYCWIASDGYMPVATKWIQYDGGWYHITKGYRDQNKWMKDSKGWCWLQADGRMLTNGWAKDSKGWCWIGPDGYMIEKNQWVDYNGGRYYIIKGYRVTGTQTIDGQTYTFDANGRLVE